MMSKTTVQDRKTATRSLPSLNQTVKNLEKKKVSTVNIRIQESQETISIPTSALDMLVDILSNMAEGKSVSLFSTDAELTTQQAADILNVSRPHVVKLLESGQIPFKKAGSHRRILLKDLIEYDTTIRKQRIQSLKFLAEQAQELKLGYE